MELTSYFSSRGNGYPPGLDPRFPAFKTAATPFVGLMAPLGTPQPPTVPTTSPLSGKDPKDQKQDALFGNPVFPPMLDMSSTQALLHMVRTANAAQNAAELETYLKGNLLLCIEIDQNEFVQANKHVLTTRYHEWNILFFPFT